MNIEPQAIQSDANAILFKMMDFDTIGQFVQMASWELARWPDNPDDENPGYVLTGIPLSRKNKDIAAPPNVSETIAKLNVFYNKDRKKEDDNVNPDSEAHWFFRENENRFFFPSTKKLPNGNLAIRFYGKGAQVKNYGPKTKGFIEKIDQTLPKGEIDSWIPGYGIYFQKFLGAIVFDFKGVDQERSLKTPKISAKSNA